MKNFIFCFGALILFFSINSFAFSNTIVTETPYFSIILPKNMHQTLHNDHNEIPLYQYVYSSSFSSNSAQQQIRISVLGKRPDNENDFSAWELKTFGAMLAIFTEANHLSLEGQSEVLGKTPNSINLANKKFSVVTMTFRPNIQAKFLVTISGNSTYMFTLVSNAPDDKTRTENMNRLMNAIKTLKYSGIKSSSIQ